MARSDPATSDVVTVAVLADTHLRDDLDRLPGAAWSVIRRADVIIHAGDVVTPHLLDALAAVAPVHAVLGNNDHALVGHLPERLEVEVGGVRLGVVHDAGTRAGRERRVHRWFPDADVVVFGHSHEPLDAEGVDGQRLLNPGSAVQRRRQPHRTMAVLVLGGGAVLARDLLVVDGDRPRRLEPDARVVGRPIDRPTPAL